MSRINYWEAYRSVNVAKGRKDQIEREFHPSGYGTEVKVTVQKDGFGDTIFVVEGHRYDSCD